MKLKVLGLCAVLLVAAVVAASQQQPPQPSPAPRPAFQQTSSEYSPAPPAPPQQPPQSPYQQPPQPPNQPAPPPAPPPPPDPIGRNLFPPEVVMQHRQAIGLSDEQKNAIRQELMKASTHFNELQWQMQDEMETLDNLTKGSTVNEAQALAELDKILNLERDVKRTQLTIAIRIKNKLTAEQQTQLRDMQQRPPQR
jgi:Spy/CpxP family protein refolding chaperone